MTDEPGDSVGLGTAADNFRPLYEQAGAKYGVAPNLIHAVADTESGGDPFAISSAGAKGLMQTMDDTNPEIGIKDPFNQEQSVNGGAAYLRKQLDHFGNPLDAIHAYNAGPAGDFSNKETQDYGAKVLARWNQLDAKDQARQAKIARAKPMSFDDLPDAAKPMSFDDLPDAKPSETPDTGFADAAKQGLFQAARGAVQTSQAVTGSTPQASTTKPIKAAEPMGWADLKDPKLLGEKALYGFTSSFPEMAGFMAGSAAGGGPETPIGIGTGALGAAIAHSATSFGPAFRTELDQTPKDPNGAFNRAMEKTGIGSVAAGLGFAAFGAVNPFESGLKNLMFQAFGVQPAVNAGAQVATNALDGKSLTEGVGASYPASVLGTIVPAAAMHGAGMMVPKGRPAEPLPQEAPQAAPQGTPPTGTGIPDPVTPDNYFDDSTATKPPEPAQPAPLAPTQQPAQPSETPPTPGSPPDPEAEAQKTLSVIAQGGDPQDQAAPPSPQPPPPSPDPAPPTPQTEPSPPPTPAPPSPPAESTAAPPKSGSYVMLDPSQLNVDPKRFQFKASDPEKGVTGALRGTDRWEPTLADPITAWQDNDGQMWVANGHQRTDLAKRAVEAGQQDVQIPAKIYREADGYTPAYMRALGAYQNIAQGSGTAIDAAKILREVNAAPGEFQLPTLPPNSALTKQATGLAKLSDDAFGAVVNGVVPAAYAAHVGDLIKDPAEQTAALAMLRKGDPQNTDQARMMVQDIRNSGFLQDTQSTLFGDEAFSKSLFPERAKVLDNALKTLRQNKGVFRAAVEGEDALAGAGNTLNREGNVQARAQNDQLIDHLERNATTKGPLSDALTAAATDLAGGKPIRAAVSQFLAQARSDHARGSEVGVERSADHGGTDAPGEGGEIGRIDAEGQDGFLAPAAPNLTPVANVDSDLISPPGTPGRFKAIRSWAIANLRGVVRSGTLGADVTINRRGIDKALNGAGDDILSAIPVVRDIIAKGDRLGAPRPPQNPAADRSTKAWHTLGGVVRIDGRDVPMFVNVREDHQGHFFYNLGNSEGGAGFSKAGDGEAGVPNLSRITPAPTPDLANPAPDRQGNIEAKNPPINSTGDDGLLAPKGRINARDQPDMFGDQPKPRAQVAPPKANPAQLDMFGRNDAAIQAQAKRDQEGRGALLAKVDQKKADQGLFADRQEGQGNLITQQRTALTNFAVTDSKGRLTPGRDLTDQVRVLPGETGQVAAAKFVATRGDLTGDEYLTAVDNGSGRVIHAGTNDLPDRVGFDPRALTGRANDSITVHHNHPGGMGFSPQDMMLLWHPVLGHVVAHSEGDVLIASLGDRASGRRDPNNPNGIPDAVAMAHKLAEDQATRLIQQGWQMTDHWPPTGAEKRQGQKSFYDLVARIMHANGVIDYVSTRALDSHVERMFVDELTHAGYNPTEIAGATRVHTQDEAQAALPQPRSDYAHEGTNEPDQPASALDARSGTEGVAGGQRGSGRRAGQQYDQRGAAGSPADRGQDLGNVGARSGSQTPVNPQRPIERFLSKARDLFENGRAKLNEALTEHFTPLAGGTTRAMDIAVKLANALRGVNYQFKLLDDHILKQFPKAEDRLAMGKAMDEQSVLEQKIQELRDNNAAQGQLGKPMMSAADLAHAEATMRAQWTQMGKGVDILPAGQRALVEQLARMGDKVWQRMRGRGMVDASAEGLPYYFARYILQRDDQGNIIKGKSGTGSGRDIHNFGANMTTSGPMSRNHLTPEETLAAAQHALGDPNAFLLQDIRAVGQALSRNERSIAGKDFIDGIKRIGVANGTNMLFHGTVPTGANPHDYFTIDGHPSFRQWMGSGFQPLHVSKEFEGPIKAVLTQPGSKLYQGAMKAKGASMTAIMWSPLMHLAVELGRALPVMRGRMLSTKFWTDGARNSRDAGYMQQATHDGLAPIGQSWREDAASIADQADVNKPPPGPLGKIVAGWHDLHQKVLWDTVFKLQVGIYDSLRTDFLNKGFDPRVAGVMAAHEANRFAGALPSENLSRWANMTSNLLLFSRSFTLGNLGVMKDMFNGMPRQTRAVIEQYAGPQTAKDAATVLRRKALGAVAFDIGLAYMANTVMQQMFAVANRTPQMGIGPAAQSVIDDWKTQAGAAIKATSEDWNPMHLTGLLPQGNNEPGKTNRAFLGKDDSGRGIYLRTSFGKVGEEFMGWGFSPAQMIENKLSPWIRPLMEDLFGEDTLGRKIYQPKPQSFSEYVANAGRAVQHVMNSLGPVDEVKGVYELGKQAAGHGDPGSDPLTAAARAILPATGIGQISSGFPGGPQAGFDFAAKQTLGWQQQQAMPTARQQFKAGDPDGARQTLLDAGVAPRSVNALLKYMNESTAQAASERFAEKRLTPTQQTQRGLMTTGAPLAQP